MNIAKKGGGRGELDLRLLKIKWVPSRQIESTTQEGVRELILPTNWYSYFFYPFFLSFSISFHVSKTQPDCLLNNTGGGRESCNSPRMQLSLHALRNEASLVARSEERQLYSEAWSWWLYFILNWGGSIQYFCSYTFHLWISLTWTNLSNLKNNHYKGNYWGKKAIAFELARMKMFWLN